MLLLDTRFTCKRLSEDAGRVEAHGVGEEEEKSTLEASNVTDESEEGVTSSFVFILLARKHNLHVGIVKKVIWMARVGFCAFLVKQEWVLGNLRGIRH